MEKHIYDNSIVYNADCMKIMRCIPDGYYDLAVVDPDFGLDEKISQGGTWAAKYKKGDGNLGGKPTQEYFNELFRISKNQIVWGGNYFIDMLYPTRCFLIWDKVAHMDTLADCEQAWTSFDKNAKIFKHVRNSTDTRIHICQKPIKLYSWIYTNYLPQGGKVFDSHLGSQSNRISAYKRGNIDFTACELDTDYFNDGNARFMEFVKKYQPAALEPVTANGQNKLF